MPMSKTAPAPRSVDAVVALAHVHRIAERRPPAVQRAERPVGEPSATALERVGGAATCTPRGTSARRTRRARTASALSSGRHRQRLLAQHMFAGVERAMAPLAWRWLGSGLYTASMSSRREHLVVRPEIVALPARPSTTTWPVCVERRSQRALVDAAGSAEHPPAHHAPSTTMRDLGHLLARE